MKKIIAALILVFMLTGSLVGCYKTNDTDLPNDEGGSESGEVLPENNEETPDNNESASNNNEQTPDSGEDTPGDGEQSPDNSEDAPNNSEEVPDNSEDLPVTPVIGTAVGDLFGDVTLATLDGGNVSTADYRGKIVILNIWATWCPPCKAELPDFNRIAREYKDDVVIIAAHTINGRADAPAYVETNFPETDIIFAYDTDYSDAYFAAGGYGYVPQTAIINGDGIIIYSASGILSYNQLVSIIEAEK